MAVAPLLREVDIGLIANKQFMTAIAETQRRGIVFITIAQHHPMKLSANIGRNGRAWTVSHTRIHHFLLMYIGQTGRYIGTIAHPI